MEEGKDPHRVPITEEDKAEAQRLTDTISSLIQDPNFEPLRPNLVGLTRSWLIRGKITEQSHMDIIRTYERITRGETTEEFVQRIKKS